MNKKQAIEYFYRKMEAGLIKNDTQQEVYEIAIDAIGKRIPRPAKETQGVADIEYVCPRCSCLNDLKFKYCWNCGQSIISHETNEL